MPPLTRVGRPVSRCAAVRARSASAGSTGDVAARGRPLRAAVLGRPLGRAHGHALVRDLLRQPTAGVVVGERQHGAGVALGDLAAGEHPRAPPRAARAGGRGSRPTASSGRRARPPRRARARTRRSARRTRAPPRPAERFSRATFSTRPRSSESRSSASRTSGRERRHARLACCAPAALAGDQLVAALGARPHDDGLEDALVRGSTPPDRRSPRARSGGAAAGGSGGSSRPGDGAARAGRLRRSAPRGRGRGRGGATR